MGVAGDRDLVGREAEMTAIATAFEHAQAGRGAVLIVEGEAGIGKTRLLVEAEDEARRRGFGCARGAALELELGRPFGAFRNALGLDHPENPALASLARTVKESASSADARYLAQEAIVDHLEHLAEQAPTLFVLDDLQWSDRATLATVWALARRVDPVPLVLLVATRPTPRSSELDRVITECLSGGATEVRLSALSPEAVETLVGNVVGANPGESLLRQLGGTGGNPFLVIEMLNSLVEEGVIETTGNAAEARARTLPPELRASLLRRIGALGTDAEDVLGVASVLAGPFSLDDLGQLLGRPIGSWSDVVTRAIRAGLIEDRGEVVAFRHDLIREAMYEHLPQSLRTALHRDAVRVLGDRLEPSVRARHLVLGASAGDAEAVGGLRTASNEIAHRDPDAAATLLDRAAELEQHPTTRAEIAAELARVLLAGGRVLEAETRAADALEVQGLLPASQASLHLTLGEARMHQGRAPGAAQHFQSALDLGLVDDDKRALAEVRLAETLLWMFDLDAAWRASETALADGRRLGNAEVVTLALGARCAARLFAANLDEAIDIGAEAVRAAGDDPDALRTTPHAYYGLALLGADRHDESRRVAEEGRRRGAALGQVLGLPKFHILLVRLAWFDGRWDDALAEADACIALADDFGLAFGLAHTDTIRGLIAFYRGDIDTAREMQARSQIARERGDVSGTEQLFLLGALLAEADGDIGEAAEQLVAFADFMVGVGMRLNQLWIGPQTVRMALAAGRTLEAARVAARLQEIGESAHTPSGRAASAVARGLVDDDPDRLLTAADEYASARRPLDRAHSLEWAADSFVRAGRTDEAITALRAGLEIAQELDAGRGVRRLQAALRALGVRVGARGERRRPATGWESLTDAEQDVARLIGERLRNPEIAEQLFISRRTVETHVSRLYAKLETDSRISLVHVIQEHLAASAV